MIFIFQKERDFIMSNNFNFSENDYSEIIEMALSDHIPFSAIKNIYGIKLLLSGRLVIQILQ